MPATTARRRRSLEALPAIARSVRSFAGDKPFHVGPSAIGMRDNPYGEAPMENPANIRQAMNRVDPRQRGLYGAAWALGYYAHFSRGGAAAVTLGGAVGEFGLAYAPMPFAQPWFDDAGSGVFPAFHVVRGLCALAGRTMLAVGSSVPRDVQAVGVETPQGRELWIANLTGEDRDVALWGEARGEMAILDEDAFVEAAGNVAAMDALVAPFAGERLKLRAYAVARLRV